VAQGLNPIGRQSLASGKPKLLDEKRSALRLFEIPRVLVCVDHIARFIGHH
jgi:hypothetical protein